MFGSDPALKALDIRAHRATDTRCPRSQDSGRGSVTVPLEPSMNHRKKSQIWVDGCVAHLKKHLAPVLLPDLTENKLSELLSAILPGRRPRSRPAGRVSARRPRSPAACTICGTQRPPKWQRRGVPESTMLALMGHMSRAMLERYSHVRMAAKREAVETGEVGSPKERPNLYSFHHSGRPGADSVTCQ